MYEDDYVVVFPDINPRASYHVLVVPKKHINDFKQAGETVINKINEVIKTLIDREKLTGKGYRVVVNGGGAQVIDHLHFHLMGNINKEREI